jgi:transcriptional regulator with XRE-family HTH domain
VQSAFEKEKKEFGQVIKNLRQEQQITQLELAVLCDVDIRTIQRIEKGVNSITLGLIFALANSLKCKPSYLFQLIENNAD